MLGCRLVDRISICHVTTVIYKILSPHNTQDGTYVWEYSQEDCPDSIVQLYLGDIKVLSNSSSSYVGGLAIVEGSEKDQVAGLELTESFLSFFLIFY